MRTLYLLARFYPYWALPLFLLLSEMGWIFRRKGRPSLQWGLWSLAAVKFVGLVLWFWFRGDLNSDRWIRAWFE